ncbi:MAG: twin-arginine translocase TatA/TatE family subunit [Hungatella sp.]|nr:twin-arginine translocase TatA/TatE family subunit [Hungatella sp.]
MKIGIQELLVVFVVALIVLGPDKLPLYARKFGEALREFRKFSSEATKDIRESIVEPLEEAQRPLKEALEPITELEKEVRSDMEGIQKSFSDIGKPVKAEKEGRAEALSRKDVSDSHTGTEAVHETEKTAAHEAETTAAHETEKTAAHEAEQTDLPAAEPEIPREPQSAVSVG